MLPKYLWCDTPPWCTLKSYCLGGSFKSKGKAIGCPVLFSVTSRMFCCTSQAFPRETGQVQVTQQGHKSFPANTELYFSTGKNTALCKKVLSRIGAEVAKFNRNSHKKQPHQVWKQNKPLWGSPICWTWDWAKLCHLSLRQSPPQSPEGLPPEQDLVLWAARN